jgi:type II secretory pathway pseudopilin PulG
MPGSDSSERGFTYIGLLVAVVIMGLVLTTASRVWTTTEQREREAQLLWVGHAYRLAIGSYYRHGGRLPETLQQLLVDDRSPVPLHHLRQLYPDPMTGQADWTLIHTADGSHIIGIASRSQGAPIKRAGFDIVDAAFADTDCYCAWQFIFVARRRAADPFIPGFSPGQIPPGPGAGGSRPGDGTPIPEFSPGQISPGPGAGGSRPGGGMPMPAPGITLPQSQTEPQ